MTWLMILLVGALVGGFAPAALTSLPAARFCAAVGATGALLAYYFMTVVATGGPGAMAAGLAAIVGAALSIAFLRWLTLPVRMAHSGPRR